MHLCGFLTIQVNCWEILRVNKMVNVCFLMRALLVYVQLLVSMFVICFRCPLSGS